MAIIDRQHCDSLKAFHASSPQLWIIPSHQSYFLKCQNQLGSGLDTRHTLPGYFHLGSQRSHVALLSINCIPAQSHRLGIGSVIRSRSLPWGPCLTVRPTLLSLSTAFSFQISCLGSGFVCLFLIVYICVSVCRFVHVSVSACRGRRCWITSPRTGVMQVDVSLLT